MDQLIVFNKAIVKHKCGYPELSGEFQQRTTQDYKNQSLKSCWNVEYEKIDKISIYKCEDHCLIGDAVLCKCCHLIIASTFNVRNSNCNIIKIVYVFFFIEMRGRNAKNTINIMIRWMSFPTCFFFLRTNLSKLNKYFC